MANYDVTLPYSIDAIDETTPDGLEDSSKLDDAIRQSRSIFKNVFLVDHNADGTHKSVAANLDANSVTGDKISGHVSDDSKRAIGTNHIKDGSITAPKLGLGAITTLLIGPAAIQDTQYGDNTIATAKYKDASVTNVKLGAGAVDSGKIAALGVATSNIADQAVTGAKIKDADIGPEKLKVTTGMILCGGSAATLACAVGGILKLVVDETTNPPTASFDTQLLSDSLSTLFPIVSLKEICSGTTGAAGQAGWYARPVGGVSTLTVDFQSSQLIDIVGGNILRFRKKGSYLVFLIGTAYAPGTALSHQVRLRDVTNNRTLLVGIMCLSPANTSTEATAIGVVTITDDNIDTQFMHFVSAAATFGLAVANTSEQIIVASMLIVKVG